MAFTIQNPSGSYLTNTVLSNRAEIVPDYSIGRTELYLLCGYPEHIPSWRYGDTSPAYYLNRVLIPSSGVTSHELFYYYAPVGPGYFGIYIRQPNGQSLTFQQQRFGHADTANDGWGTAFGKVWVDYSASSPLNSVSVPTSGYWIMQKNVPGNTSYGQFFTGSLKFTINNNAEVSVYLYTTNQNNVNHSQAQAYPYGSDPAPGFQNQEPHSGYGNGFFYRQTLTLYASQLKTKSQYQKVAYKPGNMTVKVNGTTQNTDLIPINMNVGGTATGAGSPLGNYSIHYNTNLKFVNDTNSPVSFNAYVRTDTTNCDEYPVIISGTQCKYANALNGSSINSWKWLAETVPANTTINDTYDFIIGAGSAWQWNQIFEAQ